MQPPKWPCRDSEDSARWSTARCSILVQWINRNGFHMPAIKLGKRGKGGRRMREWMGRRGCAACVHPAGKPVTAGLEAWRGRWLCVKSLGGSSAPKGSSERLGPVQEFRAAWCWEVHNILPFQLPSAHTLKHTPSAHVLHGPRKPLPCASLSTTSIPPPWSLSFSTTHWDPCQLCSGHSRNKCNTQKAPGALWKPEPTRMTTSSDELLASSH